MASLQAASASSPSVGMRQQRLHPSPPSKVLFISSSSRWWLRRRWEGKTSSCSRSKARPVVIPALFSPVAMEWQECTTELEVDVPCSVAYQCYLERENVPQWMPMISSVKAYFSAESNLSFIASLFGIRDYAALLPYNPSIADPDYIVTGARISVPFACACLSIPSAASTKFLAGSFPHALSRGETYGDVAAEFANLTTAACLQATNPGASGAARTVNVTVNCSCGDESISKRYGLFLTYPLWEGETLASVAEGYGFSSPAQANGTLMQAPVTM